MVGGKFEIASKKGHGTTISADIPISNNVPKSTPKTSRKTKPSR